MVGRQKNTAQETQAAHVRRLAEQLVELASAVAVKPTPDLVHRLRTTIRRLEVVLPKAPGARKDQWVSKRLKTLRKVAGSVRDRDVQLRKLLALPGIKIKRACEQLGATLEHTRDKHAAKLQKMLRRKYRDGLWRRIQRMLRAAHGPAQDDLATQRLVRSARRKFLSMTAAPSGGEAALHRLRIACKRLRYALETCAPAEDARSITVAQAAARKMVVQLKRVQDSIGEWHDWAVLRDAARRKPEGEGAAALSKVLRTQAQRSEWRARHCVEVVRRQLQSHADVKRISEAVVQGARRQNLVGG